tara:strand:- start:1461 stop:1772 length:312 start_codon:yes stop_codon:yes gene_type:complete
MSLIIEQDVYANGRTALRLYDDSNIPYGNITVNLPDEDLSEGHVFLDSQLTDDTSPMADVLTVLEEKHLLGRTGRICAPRHSFCVYHEAELYELDLERYHLVD